MKHNSNADFHGNVKIRGVVVDDITTQGGFYSEQFGEVAYFGDLETVNVTALHGSWRFDTSTVAGDPGNASFRLDNANPALATNIFVDDTTVEGFAIDTLAAFLASGYRIYIQQEDDATRASLFELTAGATDNTGWWTFPVSIVSTSGVLFQNNAKCRFIIGVASGAVGGSIEIAQGPNIYPSADQLNFNTTYFYLTRDTTSGDPVVNWDLGEGYTEREIRLSGDSKNIFWDWSLGNSFFLPLQKNTTLHEPSNYRGSRAQQINLVTKQPPVGFYNISFGRNFIFPGGATDDDNTTLSANAVDFFSFHYSPGINKIIVMSATELFY